ncbi:uncharacterized protein K441DRAFT_681764 [Cenococcum geophilum 1.58]|uniref:uncharacterized protein n=1 Tax=Cenococcum geophilum 1.58 TaxID=794803 RepID=UPI00358E0929|nr:hypothetical protein K441DRAFT_681764 [Cenococcum geophilum 1.58]
MDPLSVAGVALGAVSLAIQVFDGCVQGFNFLVAAVKMPETCAALRLRLIMEYNNLLVWGKVAGLIENEEGSKISSILGADQLVMASILSEIRFLLESFAELNGRYKELKPYGNKEEQDQAGSHAATIDLGKEVSSMTLLYERTKTKRPHPWDVTKFIAASKKLGAMMKHPNRIVWAVVDESNFKTLLKRLHELVAHLHGLMGGHQIQTLLDTTRKTYLEMVQVRSSVSELKSLMIAAVLLGSQGYQQRNDQILRELARLKNLNAPLSQNGENPDSTCIKAEQLKYLRENSLQAWTKATYVKPGCSPRRVWIEWKQYTMEHVQGDDSHDLKIHPNTLRWTAELAALLASPKPDDFCTPHCFGYFDDSTSRRFGWVFKIPGMSGFEYSRPDNEGTSECSKPKPQWDLYRWPDIQRAEPQEKNSRKTYDIYSLGLILLEIANWKSLGEIMGFRDVTKLPLKESRGIRSKLLDPDSPYLAQVLETVGKKYHAVVRRCIQGHEGFGIEENDDERSAETGLKLQREYTKEVVHKLKSIEL